MPSKAFAYWENESREKLDEIENAHAAVSGGRSGPGRRWATEQVNHSYLVAVAAQFQKFARDLHTEGSLLIADAIVQPDLKNAMRTLLLENRQLDKGNAHDASIGPDFKRLGFDFVAEVDALDARNPDRRRKLNQLNVWRNAVAHQDFNLKPKQLELTQGTTPNLLWVRRWRTNCGTMAKVFDVVIRDYVGRVVGTPPW